MNRQQVMALFQAHRRGELADRDLISQAISTPLPLLTDVMFNFVNAQGSQVKCLAEKKAAAKEIDLDDLLAPHYSLVYAIYDFAMQLEAYKNVLADNPQANIQLDSAELITGYINYYQKAENLRAALAA